MTDWSRDRELLSWIRRQVFIVEQGVPEVLEWDEFDAMSLHFLAYSDGAAVACARLLPTGKMGRMAVLPEFRGRGVGKAMLDVVIAVARDAGMPRLDLSAQLAAVGFYARAGFVASGEVYAEAGIPHQAMSLALG